ncbi:MAG: HlyD family efflux transporter periplasmic adaptor subunit [Oscillospiraceae bacterium]|nr:HlyD family efflux transporter periplasmic adaptor subunit [Oscillospiraceae bacterium]
MNENTSKRKEHIKTALIIFLALMLVLTFFSNTIQNYSLPIVAAQYASYGTITESVRCSGLVTANQNYDILCEGSRRVESVEVKMGEEVREGDVLFVLEGENGSEAIEQAEHALEDARLNYRRALLTAVPDYAAQNQEIANAREDLQEAIAELNKAKNSGGISRAEYETALQNAAEHTNRITALTNTQAALESGDYSAQAYAELRTRKEALDIAAGESNSAQTAYDAIMSTITVDSAAQQAQIAALERTASELALAYKRAKEDYDASGGDITLKRAMEDAETRMKYAQTDVENAKTVLTQIQTAEQNAALAKQNLLEKQEPLQLAQAAFDEELGKCEQALKQEIAEHSAALETANRTITAYESQGNVDIAVLEEQVKLQERSLQNMLIALEATKKSDSLTQQMNSLDLQGQQNTINRMQAELDELKKNNGTLTVTTKHDGVVTALNFATGDTVMNGDTLATLMMTDSGFTAQCVVTANQAKKVQIGAQADVTNSYGWGVKAHVTDIRTDTQNPTGADKIITFEVTGDVTVGQTLSFSIPCSSASYDCVVPTSAIMEDNEGRFVMVVTAKSTPLGNRYYVNRVGVEVLAADEISSAVSGELRSSDFVVTTSEKPLKNGMQIRMEE